MIRGPLNKRSYRGQFSGHETFPLRQLWLRKSFDQVSRFSSGAPRSLFTDSESIVTFGVGKNMVTSIRHWSLACGIIEEFGGSFIPSKLGKFLFDPDDGVDLFMESPATIWLLHWNVAGSTPPTRTTTWFYAFNNFSSHSFDRSILAESIMEICEAQSHWPNVSAATIKRDVECFIRSYVPSSDNKHVDDSMESVFAEIGLIQPLGTKSFQFRRGPKPSLPDGIFIFALNEFWQYYAPKQNTLAVESIIYEPGSPGRTFKLDEFSLTERLSQIEETSKGRFRWSESAGVRNVTRRDNPIEKLELLKLAYSTTSKR